MMRNFELSEFDSPDEQGSGKYMDESFLSMLDDARSLSLVFPFIINSGFRSPSHNAYVGGKEESSHQFGYAVDLHCTDSRSRFIIIDALIKAGFQSVSELVIPLSTVIMTQTRMPKSSGLTNTAGNTLCGRYF